MSSTNSNPSPSRFNVVAPSAWALDASKITTHANTQLTQNLAFPAPPPTAEIGEVTSAYSTSDTDILLRFGMGGGCAVAGVILLLVIVELIHQTDNAWWVLSAGTVLFFIMGSLTADPETKMTYVGKQGGAKVDWSKKGQKVSKKTILRYADIDAVYASQTRVYKNFIYCGTNYRFDFVGKSANVGKRDTLLYLSGTYSDTHREVGNEYYFAEALETAYLQYKLPMCQAILTQGGSITFPLRDALFGDRGYIVLSLSGLDIKLDKLQDSIPRENIEGIELKQGKVTIIRRGARKDYHKVTTDGVYIFDSSDLANARLFFMLVNPLTNVISGP